MQIYVVKEGDTVFSIANEFGVLPEDIEAVNQLQYLYLLVVGQALLIDDEISRGNDNTDKMSIYVNGYAYPFISSWVLNATVGYLTYLSVFSYGFTPDGELIEPPLDDEYMIEIANNQETAPVLTLTPFGPDGMFNNNLIHMLVTNQEAISNLIQNLKNMMDEKGFVAVDVDFEFILAEDRDLFTAFVGRLGEELRPLGYQVYVALAPKTSAEQPGLLYEGKDYKALGEVADAVLIMTYEWGYKYGPAMAVAPINQVRRVVEYAVSEIEPSKIMLGIPNYGYDWRLPYVRNQSVAKTIGNIEAIEIARENNAIISYDELAQSPYFTYYQNDILHEVWFEDVRSLNAKFDLIVEFGLRGAGYWTIMQWFEANWKLLQSRFIIKKL